MSGVRKKDQAEHRFTTLDIVLDMYDHTTTVTANPKFDRCPRIKNRIDDEAALIYHYCRSANEDYDNRDEDESLMRINLETEAIKRCMWLKTYIRLAQKKLHLRAKKVIYWNKVVNAAMDAIKRWLASEKKNRKELFGL
ncbi:MAG: hypothetical protein J6I76_00240 [Oribacterium sp.]|nr:hypothetical protein [Oribacterium sp.]